MIKAQHVANASSLAGLLFTLLCPSAALAAGDKTAAELDWRPASELTDEQRASLEWYCPGEYIEPPSAAEPDSTLVHATANSGTYEINKSTELYGNVHIAQGTRRITSPHVSMDSARNIASVDGPLIMREKGLVMTGQHATTNLFNGTGIVDSATFLLHQPQLRGSATRIERLPSTDLVINNGRFTRCEPGNNTWMIHGQKITLEQRSGFGTARNVTIDIKDVPVIYLPWLRFPIDNQRHSGFLMPSAGYEHDGGTEIIAPYYFNLAPEYDLTWQPRSLWKRGLINDIQFRFLAGKSSNEINAAYLANDGVYDDRNLVDATTGNTDTSAANIPPFVPKDRWLLNIRHTGNWSDRWRSRIDYSAVSDVDYLRDIGGDVGSKSVDQFVNAVDENLTNRRSAALDRMAELDYRGDLWSASLVTRGFQNLDTTAQKQYQLLPRFDADYANSFGRADTHLAFEYTNFDKDVTGISGALAILGQREVLDLSVGSRLAQAWGFLQPEVGVNQRAYQLRNTPAGARTQPRITTPRFSVDAGLYFDRYFRWGEHRLQQTLEPRMFFLYVPAKFQDDLPQFDVTPRTPGFAQLFRTNRFNGSDRIGDARQVSLGLTSRILDQDSGTQFLEASIGQIYYLKDRKVIYRPGKTYDPTAASSPLFLEARWSFPKGFGITGSYEWDPDTNTSNRSNFSLNYVGSDRKLFNLSYIYTNPDVQSLGKYKPSRESDISAIWPIGERWSAIGRWNFGWNLDQTIESIIGVEYNDCCWKSRLVLRRFLKEPSTVTVLEDDPTSATGYTSVTRTIIPSDTGIFFEFQLKGLATLGRRLDLLLESAIPGYRTREEKIGQ